MLKSCLHEDGLHVSSDFLDGLNKAKVVVGRKKAMDKRRLPTVSATGSLVVNVIGVDEIQSFIGNGTSNIPEK